MPDPFDEIVHQRQIRTLERQSVEVAQFDLNQPIGPRPWAYGRFLLFGSIAVIGAVDGGGKGAISAVMALAVITGKPLLGEQIHRRGDVVIVSYEDDILEWQRRFTAACVHYSLPECDVLQHVHFLRKRSGRVLFATREEGGRTTFPDEDEIIDSLKETRAALMIVDPFNHAHDLDDGNNNVQITKVAGAMSRIAAESRAAVLVLHHLRKGSNGSPDDLMGATSLRATFRSCRILARMDAAVAQQMNITDPWRYIRIAGSKENYAPPPENATWFRLIGVPLGNGTEEYPDGDEIGVATVWQPRATFDGMDAAALKAVFDTLKETIHGPSKQAKNTQWAGTPLVELGGRSQREASNIIAAWLQNGVLTKEKYYYTESKNSVWRVTLNVPKVAEILGSVAAGGAPPD